MADDENSADSHDDEIANFKYIRLFALQNSEEDEMLEDILIPHILTTVLKHNSSLFRKRWDNTYLPRLAENKGSFLAEYRVDPGRFDILHDMRAPFNETIIILQSLWELLDLLL